MSIELQDKHYSTFLINPFASERAYREEEIKAEEILNDFFSEHTFGTGIREFLFEIFVESQINLGRHKDFISEKSAYLSCHIDFQKFTLGDVDIRVKLLTNAVLFLFRYFSEKIPQSKGFNSSKLLEDFRRFLSDRQLLLTPDESKTFVKPFETTKFLFVRTTTSEVSDGNIHYDLNNLQDFLNNALWGKTFGNSIREFRLGYEISDFTGILKPWASTANLRRYSSKYKNLLVVKQLDYDKLKDLTQVEQFNMLKTNIIEAINDVDKMTKKPKDFDKNSFRTIIENALDRYRETQLIYDYQATPSKPRNEVF
jgi:hypothetical protein